MKWKSYGLKAHKGGNPQIGEETDIAAGKVPKFVAGKALKEAVK
jgi:DNA-binding protein HU-beta